MGFAAHIHSQLQGGKRVVPGSIQVKYLGFTRGPFCPHEWKQPYLTWWLGSMTAAKMVNPLLVCWSWAWGVWSALVAAIIYSLEGHMLCPLGAETSNALGPKTAETWNTKSLSGPLEVMINGAIPTSTSWFQNGISGIKNGIPSLQSLSSELAIYLCFKIVLVFYEACCFWMVCFVLWPVGFMVMDLPPCFFQYAVGLLFRC